MISIIIPVYKVEKYLDACIQSVVNQTYENLEIILVNDGSPDNCPKICDEWAKKDRRIKVIHKVNGGLSDARNVGIEASTGEFIMLVDSDDTIHPQMCEILNYYIIKNAADISACTFKKVYLDKPNEQSVYDLSKVESTVFKDNEVFDLLFNRKISAIMSPWAKLYKREIFDDIKYPVGHIHEDEYTVHKIFYKTKVLTYIDLPLYENTQRDDSITGARFSIKRLDAVRARRERWQFCKEFKPEYEQVALSNYLITLANYYLKSKKAKLGKNVLQEIKKEFDLQYKNLKKKNIFIRIFKYCRPLYALILFAKEKFLD